MQKNLEVRGAVVTALLNKTPIAKKKAEIQEKDWQKTIKTKGKRSRKKFARERLKGKVERERNENAQNSLFCFIFTSPLSALFFCVFI